MKQIGSSIETITPDIAAQWLRSNSGNRPLSRNTVEVYVTDMRAGRWQLNGETIIFDESGGLINGQHRLTACVKAGVPFVSAIVRGVDRSSFVTMDNGRRRKAADVLAISGEVNTLLLSACARTHAQLRMGFTTTLAKTVTSGVIIEEVKNYPAIRVVVNVAVGNKKLRSMVNGSVIGVFARAISLGWEEEILSAMERIGSGKHTRDDDPIWLLRERLIDNRAVATKIAKSSIEIAVTIKAVNALVQHKNVKLLRYSPTSEVFPVLVAP